MKIFGCLFGHDKEFVGVEKIVWIDESGSLERACKHGHRWLSHCNTCGKSSQIARWMCRCGVMGEIFVPVGHGLFKVHMGALVPDDKAWANHVSIIPKESRW